MTADLASPGTGALVRGIVRSVRPKQWAKNVLVFVAPGAAGVLLKPTSLLQACLAFLVFSMAAGSCYLLNDVLDVEADRRHPRKSKRPIAAGIVPIPLALVLSIVFGLGAVGLAIWRTPKFGLIIGLYLVLTTLYSSYLKHQPVLDIVGLSSGFVLRLLGGGYATDVAITDWFLIISAFGAMFIATCKREAEKKEMGDSTDTRAALATYSEGYLEYMKAVTSGLVLIAYCLFAVQRANEHPPAAVWVMLSILPFVIAILRYALLVDQGLGSAPEDVLIGDRQMQIFGVIYAVLMGVSVYAS